MDLQALEAGEGGIKQFELASLSANIIDYVGQATRILAVRFLQALNRYHDGRLRK